MAVYASPLERTTETARPIARRLGLRVRTDRGLLECDFGEWTGARLSALAKKPGVDARSSGARAASASPAVSRSSRCRPGWPRPSTRLIALHPGETVVAVSHADPIKAAVSTAAGTPLDLFQRLAVSPCSVSALAYSAGGPHVLTVNSTASLAELAIA